MKITLLSLLCLCLTTSLMGQSQSTFLYEITLRPAYQHQADWSAREHKIQEDHIAYLRQLTENQQLQIAGIIDQQLEHQSGLIILKTDNYATAKSIALADPAVKEGMMTVKIRPIQVYFRAN